MKLFENAGSKAANIVVGSKSQTFVFLFLQQAIHLITPCKLCVCISILLFFFHCFSRICFQIIVIQLLVIPPQVCSRNQVQKSASPPRNLLRSSFSGGGIVGAWPCPRSGLGSHRPPSGFPPTQHRTWIPGGCGNSPPVPTAVPYLVTNQLDKTLWRSR